jgi:hypothetical protein
MKRSVDELCDFLLDAQESYRAKMRGADKLIDDARQKFLDAVIEVEDELAEVGSPHLLDLDVGVCEFRWTDGGDLSVQLSHYLSLSKTTTPEGKVEKSCRTCINCCMDMDMDPYCAVVNKPYGLNLTRNPRPPECGEEYKLWERDTRGKR